MYRAARVAAMASLLLCLPTTAAESTTTQIGESLLLTGTELVQADLRDELTELLLELPFAWHRTGYTVELADGADAGSCSPRSRRTSRTRRWPG